MLDCSTIIEKDDLIAARLLEKVKIRSKTRICVAIIES